MRDKHNYSNHSAKSDTKNLRDRINDNLADEELHVEKKSKSHNSSGIAKRM